MNELTPRWNALLWGVTAFAAVPFFVPGWLPMTDIPEHAAAMASIAHWNDAGYRIAEHYRMGWSTSQYLLTHLVGAGLTRILGDAELACRVLLVALTVAWVQSSRSLLRAFDLDPRLAIMSAILFWNRALVVGFLPYVTSLPILFFTLAAFVRGTGDAAELWTRRSFGLAAAAIAVFYTHASAFTLLAPTASAVALTRAFARYRGQGLPPSKLIRATLRDAAIRAAWLAPASALAATWILRGRFGMNGSTIRDNNEIGTMNPFRAIKLIALYAHDIWTSHLDDFVGIAFWVLFLVQLTATIWRRDVDAAPAPSAERPGGLVPFLVAFVVYLATPFRVGTGVLLNVRMAPVLAFFALLGLRPRRGLRGSIPLCAAAALTLVQCVDNLQQISRLQRDIAGLRELLEPLPKGSRLITLNFSGFDPLAAHFTPWLHVGSYHRAMNGGVASFSFSELSHWSVQYEPAHGPPKQSELSWGMRPCLFRNERDGSYFDFVLVRGALNPFKSTPPGPRWKVRGRTAKYSLYEKDGALGPVAAGESVDEGPCCARTAPREE